MAIIQEYPPVTKMFLQHLKAKLVNTDPEHIIRTIKSLSLSTAPNLLLDDNFTEIFHLTVIILAEKLPVEMINIIGSQNEINLIQALMVWERLRKTMSKQHKEVREHAWFKKINENLDGEETGKIVILQLLIGEEKKVIKTLDQFNQQLFQQGESKYLQKKRYDIKKPEDLSILGIVNTETGGDEYLRSLGHEVEYLFTLSELTATYQ